MLNVDLKEIRCEVGLGWGLLACCFENCNEQLLKAVLCRRVCATAVGPSLVLFQRDGWNNFFICSLFQNLKIAMLR
jgi:hypothetical protein